MKKFSVKNILSLLLTAIVLALFAFYLYENPQIIEILSNISPLYIAIIMILFLLVFFTEGLFIKVTLDVFGKHIDIKEASYLSTTSRIGNYLLPMRAGAIFRATYLKKKYDFDYTKFLSTLYAYYILLFLINSALALIILLVKYISSSTIFLPVTIFFVILFVGTLTVIVLRVPIKLSHLGKSLIIKKILLLIETFMTSWDSIVRKKNLFSSLIILTTGNMILNGIINFFEFFSLGLKTNLLDIALYTCLSDVSLLFSITPGSLGLREAIFIFTSQSLGLSQDQIMQLAFLDRGIMFLLLLILLVLIMIFVRQFNLKEIFFGKEENK